MVRWLMVSSTMMGVVCPSAMVNGRLQAAGASVAPHSQQSSRLVHASQFAVDCAPGNVKSKLSALHIYSVHLPGGQFPQRIYVAKYGLLMSIGQQNGASVAKTPWLALEGKQAR